MRAPRKAVVSLTTSRHAVRSYPFVQLRSDVSKIRNDFILMEKAMALAPSDTADLMVRPSSCKFYPERLSIASGNPGTKRHEYVATTSMPQTRVVSY